MRIETTHALVSNDLEIVPKLQRKDTYMLCLEGDPLTGSDTWDIPHVSIMNQYCSQACISMIASHYGGNLSQDRISFYIYGEKYGHPPEEDLCIGLDRIMATDALRWALNNATVEYRVRTPKF